MATVGVKGLNKEERSEQKYSAEANEC